MATGSRWRVLCRAVALATGTVGLLVAAYFLLPMNRLTASTVGLLAAGLATIAGLVAWYLWTILRAAHPVLRGVQALAVIITLFLLVFATSYYLMSRDWAGNFSAPLTRVDALYFTVSVFATVGFGDIVAVTEPARLVVTVQMLGDLLVFGVLLRMVLLAVRRGRARQAAGADPDDRD